MSRPLEGTDREGAERERVEAALRESEEKYRNLVEATSDWIWETDAQGIYTYTSPRVRDVLGYEPQDVIGRTAFDFMPADEATRVAAEFARIAEKRQPFFNLVNVNLRRDGHRVILETSGVPRHGPDGAFLGFRGIDRDITERQRAEEALRENEAFIQALLDTSRDWIWAIDANAVHTYSNPAVEAILGYPADEIVGQPSLGLIHEDDRDRVSSEVAQCIEERRGWSRLAVRWRHRDGSYRFLESNSVPVLDANGAVIGFRGVDRDITERKRVEDERLELERRLLNGQKLESLGVLAGGIAHDFNNLLMAIIGHLDLAELRLPAASPVRANIAQSLHAARRAADLAGQMLAYSGKGLFRVTRLGLSELVREYAELARAAVSRMVTLRLSLAPDDVWIQADPAQVQQIIMNLLTNASEAIGEQAGVIVLRTGEEDCDAACLRRSRLEETLAPGRYAYLEVCDTGCGMDHEAQRRIFDPFFTTKFTGRGLGMSTVLGIVRGHRGTIMVDSAPGRGTTVRVLFPACAPGVEARVSPAGGSSPGPPFPALSGPVLVVDDEEVVRCLCLEYVEGHLGVHGIGAANGEEALRIFEERADEISIVLLDLTMPQMDGLATFRKMKELRPGVQVILMSGYDESDATERFTHEGLAGFLQKPFLLEQLVDKIANLPGRSA